MADAPLRVLVVDDSAVARKFVREILERSGDFELVGIARDGLDALEKIAELRPDVVTLDLVMPNLDGVGVLEALRAWETRPEVVVVSMNDEDSELGLAALAAGAFDVIKKPTALASDRMHEMSEELRAKVLAAGRRRGAGATKSEASVTERSTPVEPGRARFLAIGASTGGPQAVTLLMRALPADFPLPVAIVIHMPEGYTEAFARRLDADCALDVMEARDGISMKPGQAVVARAGRHLKLVASGSGWVTELAISPFDTPHRPAVDVLFCSIAQHVGAGSLAVVLTGMGSDGLAGARDICAAGGRVLTEAESSCVVYGMPRCIVEAGLSTAEAPIDAIAALIQKHL